MRIKQMTMLLALSSLFMAHTAQAFYNPHTGRWANRDPLEEDGGDNLYVINQNDAVNDIDNLGQITVTEGPQMLTTGTCGGYSPQRRAAHARAAHP